MTGLFKFSLPLTPQCATFVNNAIQRSDQLQFALAYGKNLRLVLCF